MTEPYQNGIRSPEQARLLELEKECDHLSEQIRLLENARSTARRRFSDAQAEHQLQEFAIYRFDKASRYGWILAPRNSWPFFIIYLIVMSGASTLGFRLIMDFFDPPVILVFFLLAVWISVCSGPVVYMYALVKTSQLGPDELARRIVNAGKRQEECVREMEVAKSESGELTKKISPLRIRFGSASQELTGIRTNIQLKKDAAFRVAQLGNWKDLRGEDWEDFLKKLFERNGFHVQTTKRSGDQGVDLVVHHGFVRLAIQAKGYEGTVGNGAVQEVVTGSKVYKCGHFCVMTNSTFSKSARDLAQANDCILVDVNGIEKMMRHRETDLLRFLRIGV
jgi:hypothetical protein